MASPRKPEDQIEEEVASSEPEWMRKYAFGDDVQEEYEGHKSHAAGTIYDTEEKSDWYGKEYTGKTKAEYESQLKIARSEQIAQEFFRLINPYQPETRLIENPAENVAVILSASKGTDEDTYTVRKMPVEKNPKERTLADLSADICNNKVKGFGSIVVTALFLHELDFRLENIFIQNKDNKLFKIDGDQSFGHIRYLSILGSNAFSRIIN